MSRAPNNPFEPNHSQEDDAPPKAKSSPWLWGFATLGVLALVGGLVCCGGGDLLFNKAMDVVADEAKKELNASPVVREH